MAKFGVWGFVLGALLAFTPVVSAQNKNVAVTDPKDADADFAVQGEYAGEITLDSAPMKVGVQVIALGDGKFHFVGHEGGLPGDGWNGSKKHEVDGETKDGVTICKNDKMTATIQKGEMVMSQTETGEKVGTLKKVERKSPTLGKAAPAGAVILFDGTNADAFPGGKLTDEKLLIQGVTSKQKFQSFTLHLEFQLSYMPFARGQGRANSGCYSQGRYEVQILDSFGLAGKNNECGGIYSIKEPEVNMCFPPLAWQTYDIEFTAAKYDADGKKTAPAKITVLHNGVQIHKDVVLPNATTAAPVKEGPEPGPIYLQDHGNPIRFRNIWLVEKTAQ